MLAIFSGKFDLFRLCGDTESSPGPSSGQSFSICHGNLNSIAAHSFSKIYFIKADNAIHTYDICHSEIYLNHDTLSDNENLRTLGYELIGLITHQIKNEAVFVYITKIFSQ